MAEPTSLERQHFSMMINAASNGDKAAEKFLRETLADIFLEAPKHAMLKVCNFVEREVWMDANREGLEKN